MPWARVALGPIKGGAENVTCETCHGDDARERAWQMPAVAALPEPHFEQLAGNSTGTTMDAQMRNAIYGYLAESDNQARAAYMREVVMPGMAGCCIVRRTISREATSTTERVRHSGVTIATG